MVQRHRAADALPVEPDLAAKAAQRITRLDRDASHLRDWLATHPADRRGPTGGIRKSNRTDNESAKMATSKGVIQGYTGVAAVDARHQIIVEAQAHGTGAEQELLVPVVEAMQALHHAAPDPLHDKSGTTTAASVDQPDDFTYDAVARTCVCPAGKSLYRKGQALSINGSVAESVRGAKRDCGRCARRAARAVLRHGGAGVRQCALQLGARSLHVAGQRKVDGQWKLYCPVHDIEKLAHAGYAA